MLKILYAADNRKSSYNHLKRFVNSYDKEHIIRTAAYSASVGNLNINWNLDALLDFTGKRKGVSFTNSNINIYTNEIREFAPDIVISDLEIYTSFLSIEMGFRVWQVSPLLLYFGTSDNNRKLGIYKYYSGIISKDLHRKKYINFIINNSDKRLVLSHLGDLRNPPALRINYEWARPSYDEKEFTDSYITCNGNASLLADYYYNNIKTNLEVDCGDPECIVSGSYNCHYGLSNNSKNGDVAFETTINHSVKFLSQHLNSITI